MDPDRGGAGWVRSSDCLLGNARVGQRGKPSIAGPDAAVGELDHILLMYGAGMSDSQLHAYSNLPLLLAGGSIKGGRHVKYSLDTPLANLHLTILDRLGVPVDTIGDSTHPLERDALFGI